MIAYTETTEHPGRVGTHVTHCCGKHGCQYGSSSDCPVATQEYQQAYACEWCYSTKHLQKQIEDLQKELVWSEALEARGLHVSGYDEGY